MTAKTALPLRDFDDVLARLRAMHQADENARENVRRRDLQLTKPEGSLGRLEELVLWLASWQAVAPPVLENVVVLVFAGNHGVANQGVSAYPAAVTEQMVANFVSGGAAINQIVACHDLALVVKPLQLKQPTQDITMVPAMSNKECIAAMNAGMNAVPERVDLLCLGEMGIGNTTVASALCAGLFDEGDVQARSGGETWVGPGTGVAAEALDRKRLAVRKALALHGRAAKESALEGLRRLGGREFAAVAGAVLEARQRRIPVVLDGFAATAAAAVLACIREDALTHCIAGHRSAEPAHGRLLEHLGMSPLLDLGLRLGEASGAALAVGLLRCAVKLHTGMATFAEAEVATRLEE